LRLRGRTAARKKAREGESSAEFGWSVLLKLLIVGTDAGLGEKTVAIPFSGATLKNCHYACTTNDPAQWMCRRPTGKRRDKSACSFLRFNWSIAAISLEFAMSAGFAKQIAPGTFSSKKLSCCEQTCALLTSDLSLGYRKVESQILR
jgi:hypothetical protein